MTGSIASAKIGAIAPAQLERNSASRLLRPIPICANIVAPHAAISPTNHPIDIDSFSFKARFGLNLILDWRRNGAPRTTEVAHHRVYCRKSRCARAFGEHAAVCSPGPRYEISFTRLVLRLVD